MRKNKQRQIYLVPCLILILFFQNCTGGFSTSENSSGSSDSSSVSIGGGALTVETQPKLLYEAAISELQSVTVKLDGTEALTFPDGLPKGALYDESQRRVNWIPARGQAGSYQVQVHEAGKAKGFIALKVGAVTERQLAVGGPPFFYSDGDVGYIYVHGAGDIDRCANKEDLARYWGFGPDMVSPDQENRLIACYDSRKAVADVAADVAKQILNSKCGRYNRCVVFTHSMGGLMMEHMFLHTREAQATDPEPAMYNNRALYQAVKDRTLFVVSLASAAGGSKSASIVNKDISLSWSQEVVSKISRVLGMNDDSTRNLVVGYASRVVAPFMEDPGVPFFMIPGFTEKTVGEYSVFGSIFNVTFNTVPLVVFNGDRSLAILDAAASFRSRSDGLVDFRSACGVQSDVEEEGPGREVSLDTHFRYCWQSKKKANHYVWFLSNMNHYVITGQPYNCRDANVPCVALFPDEANGTFAMNRNFTGLHAMEVVRQRLANPNPVILRAIANVEEPRQ